jgi:GNAT superfamily N-acetyltransferase
MPDEDRVGRLRHLYVRASLRRSGLGGQLAATLIAGPFPFAAIRFRTTNPLAARMYENIGFTGFDAPDASHLRDCRQHRYAARTVIRKLPRFTPGNCLHCSPFAGSVEVQ